MCAVSGACVVRMNVPAGVEAGAIGLHVCVSAAKCYKGEPGAAATSVQGAEGIRVTACVLPEVLAWCSSLRLLV